MQETTYGPGGYDTTKPNNNVASTTELAVRAEDTNADTLRSQALDALAANRTYIAIASPSAAQNTAQAKALTRQMNGVIRLLLGRLDGTD